MTVEDSPAGAIDVNLRGRRVLLTGGSSGIGRAILDALLMTDAEVAVVSRHDPKNWPGGAPPHNSQLLHIRADLEDVRAVLSGISEVARAPSPMFDTVVQCAATYGSPSRHPFGTTSDDEWSEVIGVNATAQFHILKALSPRLLLP